MPKKFVHRFRVFEVAQESPALLEVILLSAAESMEERGRKDRVSTGPCMGKLRIFVDNRLRADFEPGREFVIAIVPRETTAPKQVKHG